MRQKNMGHERRLQTMAREQNRDISEKVALGLAKPTQNKEAMYDSRLFNQSSGFAAGFNEDQPYDKPLFAAQEAIQNIYKPNLGGQDDDDVDDGGEAFEKIQKTSRFEVLGKAKGGFRGADIAEQRSGPVQFEKDRKDTTGQQQDPFGIDEMIGEVTGGMAGKSGGESKKRYGLNEVGDSSSKRRRVQGDDD